jgi:hypothetical protein
MAMILEKTFLIIWHIFPNKNPLYSDVNTKFAFEFLSHSQKQMANLIIGMQ